MENLEHIVATSLDPIRVRYAEDARAFLIISRDESKTPELRTWCMNRYEDLLGKIWPNLKAFRR